MNTRKITRDNPLGLSPALLDLHKLVKKHRKQLPTYIFDSVRNEIANKRYAFNQNANGDALEHKLKRYGNDGEWARQQMSELCRKLWNDKKPGNENTGAYVSIEIECILPSQSDLRTLEKLIRKAGMSKIVTFKSDGSIEHEDDEQSLELVLTIVNGEWEPIRVLCHALNTVEARVNSSCGLHVHFDYRHVKNSRRMTNAARKIAMCVPALKQMLPVSRRNNRFCQEDINTLRGNRRYAFVNVQAYKKHQTLEIRGHSGTVDASKIINWIRILDIIRGSKISSEKIQSINFMLEFYKFPEDLKTYMLARVEKFKSKNAEESSSENTSMQGIDLGRSMAGEWISTNRAIERDAARQLYINRVNNSLNNSFIMVPRNNYVPGPLQIPFVFNDYLPSRSTSNNNNGEN